MQKFLVPKLLGSERLDTIISLISSMRDQKEIILDWEKTEQIEPAGLAILSILLDQSLEKQCVLHNKNIPTKIKRRYSGHIFFTSEKQKQEKLPVPSEHDFKDEYSFMLCCQGGIDLRYKEFLHQKKYKIDADLEFSVQLVLNELMQNAVDHSTSERYYLYFGIIEEEVHFGLLDMGVSLPAKMEQKYNAVDDIEYLELSLKEGISTRRQRTGGLGLFHTFEMIKDLQGKFVFLSRDAQIRRYFSQRKVHRMTLKSRLNGTWVMFTFKNQKVIE